MKILAFYTVGNELGWDRDTFNEMTHEEAFKEMWQNRYKTDVRFYDMDSNWQYFEEDYNNEDYDGGWWVKCLTVQGDYVKQIIRESK